MDLTIEISLDLITCKNITTTINTINTIIENNNAINYFSFFETEGSRKIERNEYITSINFENKYNEPCLINTSFNAHENPIICSLNDALIELSKNRIDVLITQQYIYYINV